MSKIAPRKSPRQSRSQATVEAILEAAARILEHSGPLRPTTNRVAERAGVSVGSLYQYFPSLEAIEAELIRRMRAGMLDDIRQGAADSEGHDLPWTVDCLVRASIRHHVARPALARRLEQLEQVLPLDDETARIKAELQQTVVAVLTRHGVADAGTAARDLAALVRGMVDAAVQAGETDFDGIVARANRAVLGYLGP